MFWKFQIFIFTAWYLLFAYSVLLMPKRMGVGLLGDKPLPVPHQVLARKACKFIRFFVFNKKKNYCVLQSITLCRLLRHYGVNLELNIILAMRKDGDGQRKRGHCWPSLDGERYFDSAHDTDLDQLDLLARSADSVNYWIEKPRLKTT